MDGWQDHLHFELMGEHVLFPDLHLDSAWHFIVASILTMSLCLFERTLTFAMSQDWCPLTSIRRTRLRRTLWKTCLYWIVTMGRLLYMLVAMTNSAGLIIVAATSLSIGQFVIHYLEDSHQPEHRARHIRDSENVKEPLLETDSPTQYSHSLPLRKYSASSIAPPYDYDHQHSPVSPVSSTSRNEYSYHEDPFSEEPMSSNSRSDPAFNGRSRSRSKPNDIFIHPAESNLSRADATAQQLGVSGDTERVQSHQYSADEEVAWEVGKGRDVARSLLASASRQNTQ
ncbi:hypothetical protein EIP91_012070 [Steccherinum ochraceum]|uniref:Copper transporter n=1 Tax=Steccherinum ochraceum TaxID=92696 RepID=A0A4R0RV78_9APHY|nr:hypothetical protein EIP91_012070 [Steccherinum ochraceum]